MANFFSLQDGNLIDPSVYGYSLTGAEVMNNTTGTMLLTSTNFYSSSVNVDGNALSAIAIHLSARNANPMGTLDLTIQRTASAGVFLDSSSNNSTITTVGSAYQNTFTPFSPNGWSAYFPINGIIRYGTQSNWSFLHNTTAKWTIEFWIFPAQGGTTFTIFDTANGTTANAGILIQMLASNKIGIQMFYGSVGNYILNLSTVATNSLNIGSWNHVALTYDASLGSNNLTFYINGISSGTFSKTTNTPSNNAPFYPFSIAPTEISLGYLSNVRVLSGIILYTSSFTPSASQLTNINGTALLTLQDNRFKDNSTNNFTLTATGTVTIKDTSPFTPVAVDPAIHGGSGGFFIGNSYLQTPTNFVNLSGINWTVECWVYPTNVTPSGIAGIIASYSGGGSWVNDFAINIKTNSFLSISIGRSEFISTTQKIVANTWNHIAVVRSNINSVSAFLNGNYAVSANKEVSDVSMQLAIGQNNANGTIYPLSGYISNLRILRGTALYTSNFTPSTSPLTNITNTILLLNTNNIGLQTSATETYAISSFTGYDGSNNLLTPYPQNWQILKLTNSLSTNNGDVINYTLNTSDTNQLSLMGAVCATDNTGVNRLSAVGSPVLTSFKPYSNFDNSYYLNGTTDWFVVPANTNFNLAGDFTIEFWIITSVYTLDTAYRRIFTFGPDAANNLELMFYTTGISPIVSVYVNTANIVTGTIPVANGSWHHIAISRYNNAIRLYVDGIQSGPTVGNNTVFNAGITSPLFIGSYNNTTTGRLSAAYLNQFRIVNGTAVYTTSAFTPPIIPLTNIPNTVFLMKNGVRYDQALISSTSSIPTSVDSVHIGGSLKGLISEPRTLTATTSTFQNLYIHNQGTLTFPLTSSKTLTLNGSAGLQITSDGTLNIGTSSAVIPLSTTHTINLSNTQIDVHNGGNLNVYGYPKLFITNLVSDYPVGTNTFTVTNPVSSIWKVGDILTFKPNLTARTGFDTLTIASFTGSNTLSTTSNSLFMHMGSATYTNVAGVYNLSRNVNIQGLNSSNRTAIRTFDSAKTFINYAQLSNFGINSINKTGFVIGNNLSGSTILSGVVINSDNISGITSMIPLTGRILQNTTINNNIFNKSNTISLTSLSTISVNIANNYILSSGNTSLNISNLSGSLNMSNNTIIGSLSYGTYLYNNTLTGTYGAYNINSGLQGMMISGSNTGTIVGGGSNSLKEGVYVDASSSNLDNLSFQNISASNNSSVGFKVSGNSLNYLNPITLKINGLVANNNNDAGFEGYNIIGNLSSITTNNNYLYGMKTSIGNGPTTFDGLTSILSGTGLGVLSATNYNQTIIKNAFLSSTRPILGTGLSLNVDKLEEFRLETSTLSAAIPFKITTSRSKIEGSYLFHNSNSDSYNLSSIALTGYQSEVFTETGFSVMNENGLSAGKYRVLAAGRLSYDTINVNTVGNIASEKLEPMSTTIKLRSGSKFIPVNIGDSFIITAHVKRSSTYSGDAPRLMLKGNSSLGYSDTVLATSTGYNGIWVGVIGVVNHVLKTGIIEVYVDCSGPVGCGSINIDDWEII